MFNAGAITPGNSVGSLTIAGSLNLLTSASMTFEIGGRPQDTSYDFLRVTTSALLAGILNLSLLNNFLPSMTDTFTLMEFGFSSARAGSSAIC